MNVEIDTPGSTSDGDGQSGKAGELVVPYPVPPGLLDDLIEALGTPDGRTGGAITFADVPDLSPEVRVGWQVGVLVRLLAHGLGPVGGVDPEVLRRVGEVLRRIEEAR